MLGSSDWPGCSCLSLTCAEVVSHVPPSLTLAFPIKSSVHLAYDTIPLLVYQTEGLTGYFSQKLPSLIGLTLAQLTLCSELSPDGSENKMELF